MQDKRGEGNRNKKFRALDFFDKCIPSPKKLKIKTNKNKNKSKRKLNFDVRLCKDFEIVRYPWWGRKPWGILIKDPLFEGI